MRWKRSGLDLTVVNSTFGDYNKSSYILNEATMDPVQQWCWQYLPTAKRMSFDTFRFENEEDITLFLLRWA